MLIVVVRAIDLNHPVARVVAVRSWRASACPGVECRRWRLSNASMYSNTADWSSSRDGQLRRLTSSFFRVAKNVSATASPTGAAARRPSERDGSPRGGTPPDTAASFSAPEPHFPRLTTGSVQVSSKTGQLHSLRVERPAGHHSPL